MNARTMLDSFKTLLQNRTMVDAVANDSDVAVASVNVMCDHIMHISIEANDGTRRQFHLVEV